MPARQELVLYLLIVTSFLIGYFKGNSSSTAIRDTENIKSILTRQERLPNEFSHHALHSKVNLSSTVVSKCTFKKIPLHAMEAHGVRGGIAPTLS
jgi:hypothetical protein